MGCYYDGSQPTNHATNIYSLADKISHVVWWLRGHGATRLYSRREQRLPVGIYIKTTLLGLVCIWHCCGLVLPVAPEPYTIITQRNGGIYILVYRPIASLESRNAQAQERCNFPHANCHANFGGRTAKFLFVVGCAAFGFTPSSLVKSRLVTWFFN